MWEAGPSSLQAKPGLREEERDSLQAGPEALEVGTQNYLTGCDLGNEARIEHHPSLAFSL